MTGANQPDFAEIEETFELMDDWEQRYGYVIDLGKALSPLDPDKKTPAHKVDGCVSQVWLDMRVEEGSDGQRRFFFDGDSDAMIVRGLIAVLQALLSGRTVAEVAQSRPLEDFARLGLDSQLSPQRSNGLRAMVERIRNMATAAQGSTV